MAKKPITKKRATASAKNTSETQSQAGAGSRTRSRTKPLPKKRVAKKPVTKKRAAKKPAAKRKPGRPAHEPTQRTRDQVSRLVSYGMTRHQVADIMGLDHKTISKHYLNELKTGDLNANAAVAASLFRMAVGSPAQYDKDNNLLREEMKPQIAAAIWWSKSRMGWREPAKDVRLSGIPDGPPIKQEAETVIRAADVDPSKHSEAELAAWYQQALEAARTVH